MGGRIWTRRRVVVALGVAAAGVIAARFALPRYLRPRRTATVSDEAAEFVRACWEGIDRSEAWDMHAHLVGTEAGGNGCWFNPQMRSHMHPVLRLQFDAYLAASGVERPETADREYVQRVRELQHVHNPDGRMVLLAFDYTVDDNGRVDRARSVFHVPNDYVLRLAAEHPEFEAGVSIHPYREDAAERVRDSAASGAVLVKWLPNAQGIDPASPRCDRFYEAMAETGLPLLSHGGSEMAVSSGDHEVGNPLRLRRALEHGVRVVVAHCASTGSAIDLDHPNPRTRPEVPALGLFIRMMRDRAHGDLLHGDISALTLINRSRETVETLLTAEDVHPGLVHGSDYPISAIEPLISTWLLERRGFIDARVRRLCNEVFDHNPLIADFVLKRSMTANTDGRTMRWPASVFQTAARFRNTAAAGLA